MSPAGDRAHHAGHAEDQHVAEPIVEFRRPILNLAIALGAFGDDRQ